MLALGDHAKTRVEKSLDPLANLFINRLGFSLFLNTWANR
jgi:hypothetical protein